MILELSSSKIFRVDQKAEDLGKSGILSPKTGFWQNSIFFQGSHSFFSKGLQLIARGPPTLRREICFTQSPDLNVNLI